MRHLKAGRTLSRTASHRLALMRNLTSALIRAKDGRIITTVEKAKEARPFVEKLITLARQGTLQARRLAKARLGPCARPRHRPGQGLAGACSTECRAGGARCRAPLLHTAHAHDGVAVARGSRGDAGKTAFLELLKEGETKVRARAPSLPTTPAPKVTETPESEKPPSK